MRCIYNICTGIALLAPVFCASQIPTVGLIGGWPFTGNANDMSGSGNHGTVYGASLTKDRFGAANCAYHFNGSSNYIDMLYAGPTGSVSRSVSFWARTTYSSDVTAGYSYGTAGGGGIFQVNFNYGCQGAGFDNSNEAEIRGNSIVNNNQWHHIVAILNSSIGIKVGNVQIYIDGVMQPIISCFTGGTISTVNSNSFAPVRIGCDLGTRFFNGDLDDFYTYDRALTQTEVNNLYTYSPCVNCVGINSWQESQIAPRIFPNPFKERISISNNSMLTSYVEIYSSTGALVYRSYSDDTITVDLSGKESGIYLVKVTNEHRTYQERIIKLWGY